jgi:hypothetical protein
MCEWQIWYKLMQPIHPICFRSNFTIVILSHIYIYMHTWGWLKRNTQQHPWCQWLLILQSPKVPPLIEPYYYHCSLWSTQRASQNREKLIRHSYYVRFTEESVVNYPHTCVLNTCNVTVQNQVMDSSWMNHLSIRDSVD